MGQELLVGPCAPQARPHGLRDVPLFPRPPTSPGGLAAPGPVLPVPPATLPGVASWLLNLPVLSIIAPQTVELLHLFLFLWGFFEPQIFLQRKMLEAKI